MMAVWSDDAVIAHALAFEAALAQAQCAEGLVAPAAADAIIHACASIAIDVRELAEEAAHAGTLAIPLVGRLRGAAGSAGDAVHLGATSQDVADTVLTAQIRAAASLVLGDARRVVAALGPLAERYAATPAFQEPGPVTHLSNVAEAVWRAATDPSCPMRLPAGADAVAWAEAR